jgi:hypothetical protein
VTEGSDVSRSEFCQFCLEALEISLPDPPDAVLWPFMRVSGRVADDRIGPVR